LEAEGSAGSGRLVGELVNNYRIVSILGEGGMGSVYLAEHSFMGRKAAIKVLRQEFAKDERLVERFMNEARAANAIRHPNIIDIIDVGRLSAGIPYLMMEFLDGENLTRRIARYGRMAVGDAADVGGQTASALAAAHGAGIIHRDLKPDNLYLVTDDTQPLAHVKVLDFGIAKLRGELSGSGAKTQTGSVMGTPPYMSPEQCRGNSDRVDHRSDIYSLGIILYEMLSGAPPFVAEGWGEVALMHIGQPPPPLRSRNAEVQVELEAVIFKALAKEPSKRWTSMSEFGAALREAVPTDSLRGKPWGTVVMGAVGGTALLTVPTTLQSAAGQMATHPPPGEDEDGELPRRSWWRRSLAMTSAGALVVLAGATILFSARHSSPSPATSRPSRAAESPRAQAADSLRMPSDVGGKSSSLLKEPPFIPVAPVEVRGAVAAELPAPRAESPTLDPVHVEPARAAALVHGRPKMPSSRKVAVIAPQAGPSTKPPARPPAHTSANCDPNFSLDALGDKHFKPECFLNEPPRKGKE
jgi:serine/threonine protein kinase